MCYQTPCYCVDIIDGELIWRGLYRGRERCKKKVSNLGTLSCDQDCIIVILTRFNACRKEVWNEVLHDGFSTVRADFLAMLMFQDCQSAMTKPSKMSQRHVEVVEASSKFCHRIDVYR